MPNLPVIDLAYQIYKDFIQLNNTLPKRHRYSLGQSIEITISNLIEQIIYSKNSPKPQKPTYLIKALAKTEFLTLQTRLILELKLANQTRIFQISHKLEKLQKMLGGWVKSI